TPPTISTITDKTINEDTATDTIDFTIYDEQTDANSLGLSKSSSNPTLVPDSNIVLGGSGENRTVKITPAADEYGTTTITLTVSDGTLSSQTSFDLTVIPVNDMPSFTTGPNITSAEDDPPQTISGWATDISAGPSNESGQIISFLI